MGGEFRPIRVTPTNAGPDSKGIVTVFGWDLEGMVAFYLVVGALLGMLLIFVLTGRPMLQRVLAGMFPLGLSAAWVKVFVHGRPPAYQADVFEKWIRGSDFRLHPQSWCKKQSPRQHVLRRLAAKGESHV